MGSGGHGQGHAGSEGGLRIVQKQLSTAPSSPTHPTEPARHVTEPDEQSTTYTTYSIPPKHATAGTFSFGPATRRTVTTVTTTTTVSLPPLVIKPPLNLHERDARQYPLAFVPTPSHLRKFVTSVNGADVTFEEGEDAAVVVQKHSDLLSAIGRGHGVLEEEEAGPSIRTMSNSATQALHSVGVPRAPKRANPPSIAEAAELAGLQRRIKKPRSRLYKALDHPRDDLQRQNTASTRTITQAQNRSPLTPNEDVSAQRDSASSTFDSEQMPQGGLWAASGEQADGMEMEVDADKPNGTLQSSDEESLKLQRGGRTAEATATTPPTDRNAEGPTRSNRRQYPHQLNIAATQNDASLPSPSLSPITAAANLASRQNAFDSSFGAHVLSDRVPGAMQDLSAQRSQIPPSASDPIHKRTIPSSASAIGPTLLDIPNMVDAFDCMPEDMQTYFLYQLLRRSAKPTLQVVASVVNPALKCDPLNVLPAELGLNITRFLDAQSMCRAAQVSRRWRRLINSDEKAWKDLLERDGFVLRVGELARAVREGWGWQAPDQHDYERNLTVAETNADHATLNSDEDEPSSPTTRLATRFLPTHGRGHNRSTKRRAVYVSASQNIPDITVGAQRLKSLTSLAQGPNCVANAAVQALPHPSVGLPSLRSMHLFKSLYQRHFLIRKAWMMEEPRPQHLAFRAHHRHVVTCLLFDQDKILTGSDDTKINVYDTKTGALRQRLEGHEGGVWALQYEGSTLVSGSTDRTVRIWDIEQGRCLHVFQGHTSTVRCLIILKPEKIGTNSDGTPIMMPKEPLIITGSRDSTLRVWQFPGRVPHQQPAMPVPENENPYFLRALVGHQSSVRAISAHGDTVASGSYDCTVRVWRISTGELVHRLQGHEQKVYSVVLDPARKRCISGSMDNLVKVWDLNTGACLYNLEGHSSLVGLLDLSYNHLVSAAADSTLRIWDPETGACRATLSAHTGAITCFQHDAHKVISGSDRTLKMWNIKTGECVKDLLTDLSGVWQVKFDERRCVAAVQRNSLTYIEILDFGASREGIPEDQRGRRILVDARGREVQEVDTIHATEAMPAV